MHKRTLLAQFMLERLGLFILLVFFVLFKIPHLSVPFYWDESWSYAPGLQLMYQHGPSLMPNAIDTFYSRGHPLLFYASIASWMRLFGASHFSMHCFALFLSLALLIATFEVCRNLFNIRVAYSAATFLAVQVAFFVQASMCLPEIMVALLVLVSLYFFIAEKYLCLYLALAALLFTKESGAVLGIILGFAAFIELFNRKISWNGRVKKFISVALAGLSIGIFFLLQRKINGWFLFPEHTGLIKMDFGLFWGKLISSLNFLFNDDKRYWVFRLLAVGAVIGIFYKKKFLSIPIIITTIIFWAMFNNKLSFLPDRLMFVLIVLLFLSVLAGIIMSSKYEGTIHNISRFSTYSIAFFVLYLCFCGINFFTTRYLLCLLPIIAILISMFLDIFLKQWQFKPLWLLIPVSFLVIGIRGFQKDSSWGDLHLQAYNAMAVQQKVIHYLEQHDYFDRMIGVQSFQTAEHLKKPLTGMLSTGKTFKKVRWDIDGATELAIFDNIEPDYRYEEIKKDPSFYRILRVQSKEVWSEVYARKSIK